MGMSTKMPRVTYPGAHPIGSRLLATGSGQGEGETVIADRGLTRLSADRALIVAQGVHVGVEAVMKRELDDVEGSSNLARPRIDGSHPVHVLTEASRVAP